MDKGTHIYIYIYIYTFPLPGQHGAGKRRHDFVSGLNLRTEHTNNCNMKFLKSFFRIIMD